jgi:hypothetical protein
LFALVAVNTPLQKMTMKLKMPEQDDGGFKEETSPYTSSLYAALDTHDVDYG